MAADGELWSSGVVSGELQVVGGGLLAVLSTVCAADGSSTTPHFLLAPALSHNVLWCAVLCCVVQVALAWLAKLLQDLSQHLDRQCFRQAWGAAAAAINR
jgi:hypothetical protein